MIHKSVYEIKLFFQGLNNYRSSILRLYQVISGRRINATNIADAVENISNIRCIHTLNSVDSIVIFG